MPLLWDDEQWRWIQDGTPYDEKRFVVARKLFVQPQNPKYAFGRQNPIVSISVVFMNLN